MPQGSWIVRVALIGISCVLIATAEGAAPAFKGGLLTPARPAPEVAMATHDGTEFRLSRERGKVVALWFGSRSASWRGPPQPT
jgi:cytochrome oxidase Cu insertion factor (SCO1/SenC/PrrC family)